jgi:hypothetical protein
MFLKKPELKRIYEESKSEQLVWQEDYPVFERLANNDLLDNLDENLPEVNDGSLAAALFKLPKRIISSNLSGKVKAIDRDEAWLSELANLQWTNKIVPEANSQAPFIRKWKDAVRKAGIYGSVPLITIFVERGESATSDFIVGQPQDVSLEPGKISDSDSDVVFWDIYYTKLQIENIIEQAKESKKKAKEDGVKESEYSKWDIAALEDIIKGAGEEERVGSNGPKTERDKGQGVKGYKFFVAFQRGAEAPFHMFFTGKNKKCVREWTNPDPTGDIPIHYLYCYQDFINPYGIGIVKLAGGTQNVLDYFRQADVLATQQGIRPPVKIGGDTSETDFDSIVYAQDAQWYVGNAMVERQELANGIYSQLPNRIAMYKTSLNQLIPLGDTSIGASAGDPQYSKTPAGVKFQAASLSIDDEDFKDNLYITYEMVAKSMINTLFASMQGHDLMRLSDEEKELLVKGGMIFPENEVGETSNEIDVAWDDVRASFNFEVDPEIDKTKDDADKLEGLLKVAELRAANPMLDQELMASGKQLNIGELMSEIIRLTSDSDKIVVDITPEDQANAEIEGESEEVEEEAPVEATPEQVNVQSVMKEYGVDENTALAALSAEAQGEDPKMIMEALKRVAGGTIGTA